jgi:rhodanese-related sulfurtransferase
MGRIDELLETARARIRRLTPEEARDAMAGGGVILDTRTYEQRRADGIIPGATVMNRNIVEWRVDPTSGWEDPDVVARTGPVIVMCDEGFASSLAAAMLVDLGVEDAVDMIGGYQAWKAAGLPTEPAPPPGPPSP